MGFFRQEHWSALPLSSPMQESKKWKWSLSVVSDSQRPHGLQPTRPLHPWDFPGKSTGVGCHFHPGLLQMRASLVAQLIKNLPAMQETWVPSLGWEDPLEKEKYPGRLGYSSILAWRIPWTVCIVHGVAKSWTQLSAFHFHTFPLYFKWISFWDNFLSSLF